MPGPNHWQGIDSATDWNVAGNWDAAAVPVADDHVVIDQGASLITANLPGTGVGLNFDELHVGPNFSGQLGNASNMVFLGTIDRIVYNGARCKEAWFAVDAADAVTQMQINSAMYGEYACYLYSGTFTAVYVRKAGLVNVGTAAVITTLYLQHRTSPSTDVRMKLQAGADIPLVHMSGGIVDNYTPFNTGGDVINIYSGLWNHVGNSATNGNVQTINLWGGRFNFWSAGGTIVTINQYGGHLDLEGGTKHQDRVITTWNQFGGTVAKGGLGDLVTITNHNWQVAD